MIDSVLVVLCAQLSRSGIDMAVDCKMGKFADSFSQPIQLHICRQVASVPHLTVYSGL